MTWVKIDDSALSHPKLIAAGPEGVTLWLGGLGYANKHHTDGIIRKSLVGALYYCPAWTPATLARLTQRLVDVRLWVECEADDRCDEPYFRVHDYEDYQQNAMRSEVDAQREYERARKAAQRAARKSQANPQMSRWDSPGHVPGTSSGTSAGTSGGTPAGQVAGHDEGHVRHRESVTAMAQIDRVPVSRPDPTRPDPTQITRQATSNTNGNRELPFALSVADAPAANGASKQKREKPPESPSKAAARLARRITMAAYDEAAVAPCGNIAANWHGWQSMGDFGLKVVELAAKHDGLAFDLEDVLSATILECVVRNRQRGEDKPVGWLLGQLREVWLSIWQKVPHRKIGEVAS